MKPFATSVSRGAHEFFHVGIEQFAVADHFELDPVGVERLARQFRSEHSVLRRLAAGRVGQKLHAAGQEVDHALVIAGKTDAADRGGDHLAAARRDGVEHDLAIGIAGAAEKQPRAELMAGDDERIGHLFAPSKTSFGHPPCRARTISTLSPGLSGVSRHAARGTTAPFSATAIPRCPVSTAFSANKASTVVAASGSLSPFTRIDLLRHRKLSYSAARAGKKRSRPKGRITGSTASSRMRRAMASAVTGASRMPLRWWPVA